MTTDDREGLSGPGRGASKVRIATCGHRNHPPFGNTGTMLARLMFKAVSSPFTSHALDRRVRTERISFWGGCGMFRGRSGLFKLALALVVGAGAQGHHSPAMFDHAKTLSLNGMVREFQWTNPHCYIQLIVKGDNGIDEEWSLEMGAPMHLMGQGWKKNTLTAGRRISVTIHPLLNGAKGGEVDRVMTADGQPLVRLQ